MPTLSNVAGIVTSLKTAGGIDVERRGPPIKDIDGTSTEATPVLIHIDPCVVHNLTGKDLEQLPEVDRNRETIQIYSYVKLYVSDGGQYTDIVIYKGRKYRILSSMDYEIQGAVYISIASLQDPQG